MSFLVAEPKRPRSGEGAGSSAKKLKTQMTKEQVLKDISKNWKIVKLERDMDEPYAEWLKNRDVVLAIVRDRDVSANVLKYLTNFQDDPEVVLATICTQRSNPFAWATPSAIKHASPRLQNDIEFAKALRTELGAKDVTKPFVVRLDKYTLPNVLNIIKPFSKQRMYEAVKEGDVAEFQKQFKHATNPSIDFMIKLICQDANVTADQLSILYELLSASKNKSIKELTLEKLAETIHKREMTIFQKVLGYSKSWPIQSKEYYYRTIAYDLATSLRKAMVGHNAREEALISAKCGFLAIEYNVVWTVIDGMIRASNPNRVDRRLDFGGGSSAR